MKAFSLFCIPAAENRTLFRENSNRINGTRRANTRPQAKAVLQPTAGANRKDEPAHGHAAF